MHRDALKAACLLACAAGAWLPDGVQAQTRTHSVTPKLSVKVEHTDNVDAVSETSAQPPRSENIVTVSPSLVFEHRGANTTVDGTFGVLVEQRLQNTAADRVSPDGFIRWRTLLREQGLGLDASLQSQQVPPSIVSTGQGLDSTSTTSTQTRASVTPVLERRLNERQSLVAQFNGLLLRTDPRDDTHRTLRTHASSAQLAWLSRPAPLGYALEARSLSERSLVETPAVITGSGASSENGDTRQSSVRATVMYAWGEELEIGVLGGIEEDRRRVSFDLGGTRLQLDRDFDGPFGGLQVAWHPTPRSTLAGRYEKHETGRTWNVDVSHRLRRTTFAFNSSQSTVRNAPTLTTDLGQLSNSGQITATPTNSVLTGDRSGVTNAALSVQRTLLLRVTYEGVRTTLNLTSGQFVSRALLSANTLVNGEDRGRYHAALVAYRLTPDVTPSAGLRWNRARDGLGVSRREWVGSLGLSVRLSGRTQLEGGFSLLRGKATSNASPDESLTVVRSANVRLEHRF
jgi:uncharacterized protein (PEP-CTERM system associated)